MTLSDKQTKKIDQKKIVQKEDHHPPTKNGQLSHVFVRQTKYITKNFRKASLKVAYKTRNAVEHFLNSKPVI
jgi:homoaconitase/3-isopropylmalate dehydratase large subunit